MMFEEAETITPTSDTKVKVYLRQTLDDKCSMIGGRQIYFGMEGTMIRMLTPVREMPTPDIADVETENLPNDDLPTKRWTLSKSEIRFSDPAQNTDNFFLEKNQGNGTVPKQDKCVGTPHKHLKLHQPIDEERKNSKVHRKRKLEKGKRNSGKNKTTVLPEIAERQPNATYLQRTDRRSQSTNPKESPKKVLPSIKSTCSQLKLYEGKLGSTTLLHMPLNNNNTLPRLRMTHHQDSNLCKGKGIRQRHMGSDKTSISTLSSISHTSAEKPHGYTDIANPRTEDKSPKVDLSRNHRRNTKQHEAFLQLSKKESCDVLPHDNSPSRFHNHTNAVYRSSLDEALSLPTLKQKKLPPIEAKLGHTRG